MKVIRALAVLILVVLVIGGLWLRWRITASLPNLDGTILVVGLTAPVTVERDDLGVPTITGSSRLDVARATGFVHAQDRFFQMDLLRRKAAGELAALVGPAALQVDRDVRRHRFRDVSGQIMKGLSSDGIALLNAYADGVNAGLAALGASPTEYALLRTEPVPWLAEDCGLVFLAMYLTLQDGSRRIESDLGLMHDLLPSSLVNFLLPLGSDWDAAIDGSVGRGLSPIPLAEHYSLRHDEATEPLEPAGTTYTPGSNNWAVSSLRSGTGRAVLANDMHLELGLPNTWYRARMVWNDDDGNHTMTGLTLPGVPALIAGSNEHIAWGYTNSYGDWSDLVLLEIDPDDEEMYLTPDGPERMQRFTERIEIKGEDPEFVDILWTRWGPVVDRDHRGRQRALRWVAHDAGVNNMSLALLERARDLDQALDLANRIGIPAQNFIAADRDGRIGWTIIGPIPRRRLALSTPVSWASGQAAWNGWLTPDEYPQVVDPDDGILWTANNRVIGGKSPSALSVIGDGGFVGGARARQIRDGLLDQERLDEMAMLRLQLDDRALFLSRWRELLLELLTDDAISTVPRRAEFRRLVADDWDGRASIDSTGYRLVRGFRSVLARQVFGAITAPCTDASPEFNFLRAARWEAPLWTLIHEQPPHLVSPEHADWNAALLAAVDTTLDYFLDGGAPLETKTWGSRNTVPLRHPLSRAVPQFARWLDVESQQLPGDSNMPRVQSPTFGASQRMAVSPGQEEHGILHMPGGQSGHPLSPFYRKGHDAWVEGKATPFLPGPTKHKLTLSGVRSNKSTL